MIALTRVQTLTSCRRAGSSARSARRPPRRSSPRTRWPPRPACRTRAGRCRARSVPTPEMRSRMRPRMPARAASSQPSPIRSSVPGTKDSITTSNCGSSACSSSSTPCRRLEIEGDEPFVARVDLPPERLAGRWSSWRSGSPVPGCSTLTTSAPKSASSSADQASGHHPRQIENAQAREGSCGRRRRGWERLHRVVAAIRRRESGYWGLSGNANAISVSAVGLRRKPPPPARTTTYCLPSRPM